MSGLELTGFDEMIRALETLPTVATQTMFDRVVQALQPIKPTLLQLARDTHGWANRTGRAERGLQTDIVADVAELLIQLSLEHGPDVDYGYWLETRFEGRYGVIIQALEGVMPDIRAALR